MKIVSTGSTISSPEFYKKKLHKRRKRNTIFGFLALTLLIGAVIILRLESLRIGAISVIGAEVVGVEDVESTAKKVLSGRYLWLVPKDNAIVYPRVRLKQELASRFPRLNSITLSLMSLNTLTISITEREPHALYCADSTESGVCYFLDEGGFIFDPAPAFSEGVYLTFSSEPVLENPKGIELMPQSEFVLLSHFLAKFDDLGLEPLVINIFTDRFEARLESGSKIIWNRGGDLALVFASLESFLESPSIKEFPDFHERLSILDLRTDNKVFYQFK